MTSNAISAHGTLLQVGDAAPGTYATIAEVKDIKGPQIKGVREDVTNHSSGGWKESRPVLKEGGKVSMSLNYVNAEVTHNKTTGLLYKAVNQTLGYFKLIFPDSSGFTFTAYVDMDYEAKVKGILSSSVELEITGALTPL
jgi:hypothetical protein